MNWISLWSFLGFGRKRPIHKANPDATPRDVERIVRRDFLAEAVAATDSEFRSQWPGEHARVHVACLKLADGDLAKLKKMIEVANTDFRDVLLWAHNPEENRRMGPYSGFSKAEDQAIVDRDWQQFQQWFKK